MARYLKTELYKAESLYYPLLRTSTGFLPNSGKKEKEKKKKVQTSEPLAEINATQSEDESYIAF